MVTHSKEYEVQTTVQTFRMGGLWEACESVPSILGVDRIRSCEDLARTMETLGGVVARLLDGRPLPCFRLVTREKTTGSVVGLVQWCQQPDGSWAPWDTPFVACDYGQCAPVVTVERFRPTRPVRLVA
ncbi:hypothetical protein ACFW6R_23290 [Streptomyces albidoflavus]